MHAAMVCSDDPVHSTSDVITEGTGRYATAFGESTAEEYVVMCSVLDVEELPDSTGVDVRRDVPVLLLSGSLDVATPAYRCQIVADALPNATHQAPPENDKMTEKNPAVVAGRGVRNCATMIVASYFKSCYLLQSCQPSS